MRKAVVNDSTGLVENIVVVDGPFDPGPGRTLMDEADARIGGTWDGSVFLPPPPPVAVPDPQAELDAAIAAATTLDELKAALLGQASAGKVVGKTP